MTDHDPRTENRTEHRAESCKDAATVLRIRWETLVCTYRHEDDIPLDQIEIFDRQVEIVSSNGTTTCQIDDFSWLSSQPDR